MLSGTFRMLYMTIMYVGDVHEMSKWKKKKSKGRRLNYQGPSASPAEGDTPPSDYQSTAH
jgi:hypothetical protein